MEIKSTEFFRNMKTLPPPGTEEFRQLIKWEEEKILLIYRKLNYLKTSILNYIVNT